MELVGVVGVGVGVVYRDSEVVGVVVGVLEWVWGV